jgi:hypothetical protein
MTPHLPTELLRTIVSLADAADLPALARANKTFQALAESFLYQGIVLRDSRDDSSLHSVVARPERHSYLLALIVDSYSDPRVVHHALGVACKLVFLSLTSIPYEQTSYLLGACASAQLKHVIVSTSGDGDGDDDEAVAGARAAPRRASRAPRPQTRPSH